MSPSRDQDIHHAGVASDYRIEKCCVREEEDREKVTSRHKSAGNRERILWRIETTCPLVLILGFQVSASRDKSLNSHEMAEFSRPDQCCVRGEDWGSVILFVRLRGRIKQHSRQHKQITRDTCLLIRILGIHICTCFHQHID